MCVTVLDMRYCTHPGCPRPYYAKDLCRPHYRRQARGASLDPEIKRQGALCWSRWKINARGYVYRQRTLRPDEERTTVRNQVAEFQHRFVMELVLGRSLRPEETVHHKNGNRADNRPENLELWSSSQPAGQRVEDKLTWAREIVKLYG